ncbi:phage tail protein [Zooshikella harenae]|uniref:Phage tail protein n=1 Tax=Zooshikella harenae TaxID=2827238 RepID=A0ABS5ZHC6_9GAMM|nr:tail fiber protein [Zooshikella harenae]MBU2713464.1 phage tail protein [Zooshikella harenae]
MAEPFIAQIQLWGCNYAPRGWAYCDGGLLSIAENTALFSLIGTTYGGDGRTTMGIPNLQGRAPMHPGNGPGLTPRLLAERGGSEEVLLTQATMPKHTHQMYAEDADAEETETVADYLARGGTPGRGGRFYPIDTYNDPENLMPLSSSSLTETGLGQGHENRQPFLAVNFCMALMGIYPNRS